MSSQTDNQINAHCFQNTAKRKNEILNFSSTENLSTNNTDESIPPNNHQKPDTENNHQNRSTTDNVEKYVVNISKYHFIKTNMIVYYGRQLFCLLIVILTVYATYHNIPLNNSKPPEARPFFFGDSFVKDYPTGELLTTQTQVSLSDLSFVMFYAPWSADSQHARKPFEDVAKLFHKEAHFAAINCWQPGGECRQQYAKVMSWPVLMAYNLNNVAVPYTGQWTESALTKFILTLLQPLKRISTPNELLTLMHNHDAVIVAFFDMKTDNQFYKVYLHMAIKWLERDPYQEISFAIVTGDSMKAFGVDKSPSLRLYLWNDTLEYQRNIWKPSLLINWMSKNLQQITTWISPPGTKSMEFKPFLARGPVLVLFTPRNLYESTNDAYSMLRQISYEYHNCNNDDWIKEMTRIYIQRERKENYQNHFVMRKKCEKLFDWKTNVPEKCSPFGKRTFVHLVNSSKYTYHLPKPDRNTEQNEYCSANSGNSNVNNFNHFQESCSIVKDIPFDDDLSTTKTLNEEKIQTSMLNDEHDYRSSKNIKKTWMAINCKLNSLSKSIRPNLFYDTFDDVADDANATFFEKISGLACRFNRTMSFLAMDSFTYELIAERLGIQLDSLPFNTTAVIIDSENESTYVLKNAITTQKLVNFIHNFTNNKLHRYLRNNANLIHSHFFNDDNHFNFEYYHPPVTKTPTTANATETLNANNSTDWKSDHDNNSSKRGQMKFITIKEIDSTNFNRYVLNSNKIVAVLFYSTQCAFCTIFSSALLTVSKILNDLTTLKFVRIDADRNDLPWTFTMDTLPTFIIFNGQRKSDSYKFPSTLPVTEKNILGFILSNLNRPNRLFAMLLILKHNTRITTQQHFESGLIAMRREIVDSITHNLRLWRTNPKRRITILRRIQALQRLYLELYRINHVNDLTRLNRLVRNILNVWISDDVH